MKDLAAKFTEVERRVRKLVDENSALRGQVRELEKELAGARRDARDLEQAQDRSTEVRRKLERVLQMLETLGGSVEDEEAERKG